MAILYALFLADCQLSLQSVREKLPAIDLSGNRSVYAILV